MTTNDDLLKAYNYDSFTMDKVNPWMRWDESPALGERIADFRLWQLDERETALMEVLKRNRYTVVEFGSFT